MRVRALSVLTTVTAAIALTGCGSPDLEDRLGDEQLMSQYLSSVRSQTMTALSDDDLETHARRVCRMLADGRDATAVTAQEVRWVTNYEDIIVTVPAAVKTLCPEFESAFD